MNPILETLSIVKLQRSGDPSEMAFGDVLQAINELSLEVAAVRTEVRKLDRFAGKRPSSPFASVPRQTPFAVFTDEEVAARKRALEEARSSLKATNQENTQ